LVIDPDAVEPDQIPLQGFKVIARGGLEIPQFHGGVKHVQFSQSGFEDGRREPPDVLHRVAIEHCFSGSVAE